MAITFPFKSILKTQRRDKIQCSEESTFWVNLQDTMNNLVSRFNAAKPASIPPITIRTVVTQGGPLTAEDYDYNIVAFESTANQIINNGEALGFNSSNPIVMNKTTDFEFPMSIKQRDENVATVQIFINTAQQLYVMAGI